MIQITTLYPKQIMNKRKMMQVSILRELTKIKFLFVVFFIPSFDEMKSFSEEIIKCYIDERLINNNTSLQKKVIKNNNNQPKPTKKQTNKKFSFRSLA